MTKKKTKEIQVKVEDPTKTDAMKKSTMDLAGREFTILQIANPMLDSGDGDGALIKVEGYIDHARCLIVVDSEITESAKKETILHEIIHGVSNAFDLNFNEETVRRLARALRASNVEFVGEY